METLIWTGPGLGQYYIRLDSGADPSVENSVLLKCRKLRREDQETSDSIVSRISLFYDMCCYL